MVALELEYTIAVHASHESKRVITLQEGLFDGVRYKMGKMLSWNLLHAQKQSTYSKGGRSVRIFVVLSSS